MSAQMYSDGMLAARTIKPAQCLVQDFKRLKRQAMFTARHRHDDHCEGDELHDDEITALQAQDASYMSINSGSPRGTEIRAMAAVLGQRSTINRGGELTG